MARSSASTRRLPLSRPALLVGALLCALGLGACSAPLTSTGVNAPVITPVESSVSSAVSGVVVLPTTEPTTTSSVPVVTTVPVTTTHTVTHPVTHAPTHAAAPKHTAPTHTAAPTTKKAASCDADYYRNSSGNCVHRPSSNPAGATAKCKDGTYSYSQHHSGTCSGHHGVAEWL